MQFDSLHDWVRLYASAGLSEVQVETGPFDMMTPAGFLYDEGLANAAAVMARAMSRWSQLHDPGLDNIATFVFGRYGSSIR